MSSKVVEIEEKTIDGAIEKACRDFGVAREKLNIEIISEGSTGFLGLGAKKAKIRASLLSFDMDFPMEELKASPREENKMGRQPESKPTTKPRPDKETIGKTGQIQQRQQQAAKGGRSADSAAGVPSDAQPATSDKAQIPTNRHIGAPTTATPSALKARQLLTDILNMMTFECEVSATETDEAIVLNVQGDKSALLIGRRGQNLDALQYLLNKAVNKTETERKMIVVDSEEYRKRREETLLKMAERIRAKVKKTQKPLSLSHMNARDRRIIHMALQEDETLVTKSRGEGEYRKVIVLPVRKNAGGQQKVKNGQ